MGNILLQSRLYSPRTGTRNRSSGSPLRYMLVRSPEGNRRLENNNPNRWGRLRSMAILWPVANILYYRWHLASNSCKYMLGILAFGRLTMSPTLSPQTWPCHPILHVRHWTMGTVQLSGYSHFVVRGPKWVLLWGMLLKLEAIICLETLRLLGSFNCWGLGEIGYSSYLFFLAQHAKSDTRECILINSLRQDDDLNETQSERLSSKWSAAVSAFVWPPTSIIYTSGKNKEFIKGK